MKARVRACPPSELFISVITVEEQLSGWYALLRRARQPHDIAAAYDRLAASVALLAELPILRFPEPAVHRFKQLEAMKLNVTGNDLRIAAIALEHGAAVVTRNVRDFRRVPGLVVEDWAV